jgi:hypothetical protein
MGYNTLVLPEIKLDDIVTLRKPHPCGSTDWKITRLGADIGLECLQCKRVVLLPRRELARRLKRIHPQPPVPPDGGGQG